LGFVVGARAGFARLRPALDLRLGGGNALETIFAARQFGRQVQAIRQVAGVCAGRLLQQLSDFRLEVRFALQRVLPRQRLARTGMGLDLGAVQRDPAELTRPHLVRPAQDLNQQRGQFLEEALATLRQGVVIRMPVGTDETEGYRVVAGPLQRPRGVHPGGVPVKQHRHQHRRVVGLLAASAIPSFPRRQVKRIHHLHH
jgi:hypothetical protein